MFENSRAFSSFSVDDIAAARKFYVETLGLRAAEEMGGLRLSVPGGGEVFVYLKGEAHQPATFTVLNFGVDDIDAAVDRLNAAGVDTNIYDPGEFRTDERGIARGSAEWGPDIAWFRDPAGNVLSVLATPS